MLTSNLSKPVSVESVTNIEVVRISEMNLATSVSTPNIATMIFEHSTRASRVQQLRLLPLLQVKADHLVLDDRSLKALSLL